MSNIYHQQPTRPPKVHYKTTHENYKRRKQLLCDKSRLFKSTTDIDKVTCEVCKKILIEKGFIEVVEDEQL